MATSVIFCSNNYYLTKVYETFEGKGVPCEDIWLHEGIRVLIHRQFFLSERHV